MKVIHADFFDRPVLEVARDLVGCYLVRKINGKMERHMITETEAYDGEKDLACHASKGQTKRNAIMFGPPGIAYVYFTYGMHWLLNVITGPKGYPAGVLIRGIEGTYGPARLTKKLHIDGMMNGKKLGTASGLRIEARSKTSGRLKIERLPRVGVDYAGPIWAKKKWRFRIEDASI